MGNLYVFCIKKEEKGSKIYIKFTIMVIKIKNTMIKKKMTIKKKCNYNKTNKTYKKKTKCRISVII